MSDNGILLHVVSGSSVLLNVGNVKSFPGRGVGHLFSYFLSCTDLSSVSLLDAMLDFVIVRELM